MRLADWIVVALYFAYVIWEGFRYGKKNRNIDDYFRGKRSLRWWAVGLSVMATQASAITYIGTTGQAYDAGMSFIQVYLPQPLVMVVLCMTFVPFFYRANIFTAYEYLEKRFDARTRSLTSFLFLMSRGLAVSLVLYAPSIILAVIFGWSEVFTILVMGIFMFVAYHFVKPPLNFNAAYHQVLMQQAGDEYSELERKYDSVFRERRDAALELNQARKSGDPNLLKAAEMRCLGAEENFRKIKEENHLLFPISITM